VIASDGGRDGKNGRYCYTQDRRPPNCEGGLTNSERQCARGNADEQRADNAGAAVKRRDANADSDEKRQGIDRQGKDQPAEQADTDGVEDKSKGEHGGGSVCKGVTVAPSTTTAAQFWT